MAPRPVLIGESFVGEGAEAAHVNTVLGDRHGPVGTAWATVLATPRAGHSALVTVLQPDLPVKPRRNASRQALRTPHPHPPPPRPVRTGSCVVTSFTAR